MRRGIAIGVVVYNSGESLLGRFKLATDAGFSVYVFDNSPHLYSVKEFSKACQNLNYHTCGKNVGLGFGISTVCAQAEGDDYQALVFFDQDTGFSLETLDFIESFYLKNAECSSDYSSFLFNSKDMNNPETDNDRGLKDIVLSINSGSLYFLKNLKKLNWHDCSYFVDGVDYKFCLDSARQGMKIGECSYTPGFDHVTEQEDTVYTLFGKNYQLRPYPWRRFVDTSMSSIRLIASSFSTGDWKFSKVVTRLFIIYVLSQLYVRVVDFGRGKKDV